MRKEIPAKTTKTEIYCDDCGKKIHWDLQCSVSRCEYCNKDLCEKCVAMEKSTDGDYREVYCKKCWDIVKPYYEKIAKLDDEIEKLYDECEKRCKE